MRLHFTRSITVGTFRGNPGETVTDPDLPESVIQRLVADGSARIIGGEVSTWRLSMSPEVYLDRYPNGKHAELARRVIDQQ